jgi:hypothetical protein
MQHYRCKLGRQSRVQSHNLRSATNAMYPSHQEMIKSSRKIFSKLRHGSQRYGTVLVSKIDNGYIVNLGEVPLALGFPQWESVDEATA